VKSGHEMPGYVWLFQERSG